MSSSNVNNSTSNLLVVGKESIQVIAQKIGNNNLSPDIFPSLAADVEYRLREIMQVIPPIHPPFFFG